MWGSIQLATWHTCQSWAQASGGSSKSASASVTLTVITSHAFCQHRRRTTSVNSCKLIRSQWHSTVSISTRVITITLDHHHSLIVITNLPHNNHHSASQSAPPLPHCQHHHFLTVITILLHSHHHHPFTVNTATFSQSIPPLPQSSPPLSHSQHHSPSQLAPPLPPSQHHHSLAVITTLPLSKHHLARSNTYFSSPSSPSPFPLIYFPLPRLLSPLISCSLSPLTHHPALTTTTKNTVPVELELLGSRRSPPVACIKK